VPVDPKASPAVNFSFGSTLGSGVRKWLEARACIHQDENKGIRAMKTLVPMLTIKKLVEALKAIEMETNNANPSIGLINVIASGTIKDTAEEIETIKKEAMEFGV
jgi:hypothetical protein